MKSVLDYYLLILFGFFVSVVKMKFKRIRRLSLKGNKVNTVFKTWRGTPLELRKLRRPHLSLDDASECCSDWLQDQPNKQRYLVMGLKKGDELVPTFILPWVKSKVIHYIVILTFYKMCLSIAFV